MDNINLKGPISPDATVNKINLNIYNCFIFTYHDQALIPFKLISNYSGVNYTSGLNIIRISPVHGTAYNIVGKNIANKRSLISWMPIYPVEPAIKTFSFFIV